MILIEMSISAALLILMIIVIRSLAIHSIPKVTFMVLWGVVLFRLFIPFSLSSPFQNLGLADKLNGYLIRLSAPSVATLPQTSTIQLSIHLTQQAAAPITIDPILGIWAAGLILCALFFLIPHLRSLREYRTALPVNHPVIVQWLREQKTIRPIHIRQFDRISAPFTYGLFRPVILLPKGMDWSDEKQLQYILTHEFIHIKRLDALWKWLLAAGLCIHWFNPLVWIMYVLANRDIELSCDEAVVRAFGANQKSAYALTLVRMEERRSLQTLLCNNFSRNAIKERIDAIIKLKKTSLTGITAALFLVIVAATACATTGPIKIGTPTPGNGNSSGATLVPLNSPTSITPISTVMNGNSLAAPTSGYPIDTGNVYAISVSDGNYLSQPITSPIEQINITADSIVIKFHQDMDASTLNSHSVIIADEHSTILTNAFDFNYHEDTRELHLNLKPEMRPAVTLPSLFGTGPASPVQVILTQNIRTANGKSLNSEIDFMFDYLIVKN